VFFLNSLLYPTRNDIGQYDGIVISIHNVRHKIRGILDLKVHDEENYDVASLYIFFVSGI